MKDSGLNANHETSIAKLGKLVSTETGQPQGLPMSIHPQVIEKEGKKEFVILPYEEFLAIKESLEDFEDLKELRDAKAESTDENTVKLVDIRDDLLEN